MGPLGHTSHCRNKKRKTIEIDHHNNTKRNKTQMEDYSRWRLSIIYIDKTYVVGIYFFAISL
jgi:hypothetical protein